MALKLDRETLTRLSPWLPAMIVAALALFIAWAFARTTIVNARQMGLPLDDSYIYLTYAKQFGRGQPFTYFPGGGYSAGATSVLWPMLLAPFWTFGARGHALVWVSFGMCAVLYAAAGVGIYRVVRTVSGATDHVAGLAAAAMALVIAPFAFCALSGMEVALACALLVGCIVLLARHPREGRPTWLLIACLAATTLARPESLLLVGGVVGGSVLVRLYRRAWREALWWLVPLGPAFVWLVANRLLAGHFMPNSGVAKSHFYQPGFDAAYWWEAVQDLAGKLFAELLDDTKSPLVWPNAFLLLYIGGSIRIAVWAGRERRPAAGAFAILAPLVLMLAVVGTSGMWGFQNYRYIAAALPLLFIPIGAALLPLVTLRWLRRGWQLVVLVGAALFIREARWRLVDDMKLFAQGVLDTNAQVVELGDYIHRKLPHARVMLHDAGALAYYGDGPVVDMLGLVTNHQADIAINGPGSRFEYLESLPAAERPDYFVYYPIWLGTTELFGPVVRHTILPSRVIAPTDKRRLLGGPDMQIIEPNWDHVHTAERPINVHPGWAVVDRIDVADLESERAHDWRGRLGRRHFGDPTAKWSVLERSTASGTLYIDGGRTIRDGGEEFRVTLDPAKPTRLVLRTGGQASYQFNDNLTKPIDMTIHTGSRKLATLTVGPPVGSFVELAFNLPPQAATSSTLDVRVSATGPYRVFHWFVLQPE